MDNIDSTHAYIMPNGCYHAHMGCGHDISSCQCHAYNPYEHDNMDKKIHCQGWMQIDVR